MKERMTVKSWPVTLHWINAPKLSDGAKKEVGSRWVPEPERVLSSVELDTSNLHHYFIS
jgi:hypothetical protein